MKQLVHQTDKLFISTIQIDSSIALMDAISGHNPDSYPYETMVFKRLNEEDIDFQHPLETKWYHTQQEAEAGHQELVSKYTAA